MNAKSRRPATRAASRPTTRPAAKSVASGARKRRSAANPAPRPAAATPNESSSKQAQMIEMLRSSDGGTIEQLKELTGWQAHTVRGTVSGVLRKKLKLNVVCSPAASGPRVYRIVETRTRSPDLTSRTERA